MLSFIALAWADCWLQVPSTPAQWETDYIIRFLKNKNFGKRIPQSVSLKKNIMETDYTIRFLKKKIVGNGFHIPFP